MRMFYKRTAIAIWTAHIFFNSALCSNKFPYFATIISFLLFIICCISVEKICQTKPTLRPFLYFLCDSKMIPSFLLSKSFHWYSTQEFTVILSWMYNAQLYRIHSGTQRPRSEGQMNQEISPITRNQFELQGGGRLHYYFHLYIYTSLSKGTTSLRRSPQQCLRKHPHGRVGIPCKKTSM